MFYKTNPLKENRNAWNNYLEFSKSNKRDYKDKKTLSLYMRHIMNFYDVADVLTVFIPKEPIEIKDGEYVCGACNNYITSEPDKDVCCPSCGQQIDWEGKK